MSQFETSEMEDRYEVLEKHEFAGLITDLHLFPKLKLTDAEIPYRPAFTYKRNTVQIYEYFKTKKDPRVKDLVRLWPHYGHGILLLTEFKNGELVTTKRVIGHNGGPDDDDRFNR